MRRYEMMLILPADADDRMIGGVTDRISQVLGGHGGEVGKVDRWGKRRFAFPIGKLTDGFYLVVEMLAEPAAIKELDRVLSLADDVIRFKVLVLPEKRERAAAGEEDAERGEVRQPAAARETGAA